MDGEEIYRLTGELYFSFPLFDGGPLEDEDYRWLGRLHAVLSEKFMGVEIVELDRLTKLLRIHDAQTRDASTEGVKKILFRALAGAELKAPIAVRGAFIPAGNAFDALSSLGKIMHQASRELLIVDRYMSERGLTDYGVLASEGVMLKLLADLKGVKPSLEPAVKAWTKQHGNVRPLEVRLTAAGTLHDRLIIVDDSTVWLLTQSLNAFARRSPATIQRSDPDTAALKVQAYSQIWQGSTPLI